MTEGFLFDLPKYEQLSEFREIERQYVAFLAGVKLSSNPAPGKQQNESVIVKEIQKARDLIKSQIGGVPTGVPLDNSRIDQLEATVQALVSRISQLEIEINSLRSPTSITTGAQKTPGQVKSVVSKPKTPVETKSKSPVAAGAGGDDDEGGLFDSDSEEDEAAAQLKAKRLADYAERKSAKPQTIAKSTIVLDVKPWDDETDMNEVEKAVRSIKADGLVWAAGKLVPLAYGIKKLTINCIVEDDKVGTDFLEESITSFTDLVQSVDIAAFNKI